MKASQELAEEVGLLPDHVRIIGNTRGWLRYRLPSRLIRPCSDRPACIGQKQVWFLLRMISARREREYRFLRISLVWRRSAPSSVSMSDIVLSTLERLCFIFGNSPLTALLQRIIPNPLQGRVLSILNALMNLAAPVGLLAMTPLGELLGVRYVFVLASALGAIVSVLPVPVVAGSGTLWRASAIGLAFHTKKQYHLSWVFPLNLELILCITRHWYNPPLLLIKT